MHPLKLSCFFENKDSRDSNRGSTPEAPSTRIEEVIPGKLTGAEATEDIKTSVPKKKYKINLSNKINIIDTISLQEANKAKSLSPCDQVRRNAHYWSSMSNSDFAVNLIKRGLTIPFYDKLKIQKACRLNINERPTSTSKQKLLHKEIKDLLKLNVIERVPCGTKVYENYIFTKLKPSGKVRVIFDMKQLNIDIKLPKLNMFKFSQAYQDLIHNSFACKVDLSNAYWHIGVNINYRRFLAFKFNGVTYQWKAMPFGLKTAPYLFCKLMGCFIKHIKVKFNIIIFYYMDDLFIVGPSKVTTELHVNIVIRELNLAGLSVNFEKSVLTPTQIIDFLGVKVNLNDKWLGPSQHNSSSCIKKVKQFRKYDACFLDQFQSLMGSLNFVASFMKFGRLFLSPLYRFMSYFTNDRLKPIPSHLKESLKWWSHSDNYCPIKIPDFNKPIIKLFSDASSTGWGVHIIWADLSQDNFHGNWSENELKYHINIKEFMTIWLILSRYPEKFTNYVIKIYSDNKATVHWLKKEASSRSNDARWILGKMLRLKYDFNLLWTPIYLKGSHNTIADSLSRSLTYNSEISLSSECFNKLCNLSNYFPDIDLFANSFNRKCNLFFSASPSPDSLGTDAFAHSWDSFRCIYAFPPAHLINKTIYKYLSSKCNKLLLVFSRLNHQTFKNLTVLRANFLSHTFSLKDIISPQNTNLSALEASNLIACSL